MSMKIIDDQWNTLELNGVSKCYTDFAPNSQWQAAMHFSNRKHSTWNGTSMRIVSLWVTSPIYFKSFESDIERKNYDENIDHCSGQLVGHPESTRAVIQRTET